MNDIIYALFLTGSYSNKEGIKTLYKANKKAFVKYMSFIFHVQFQKLIYNWIERDYVNNFIQEEYDEIFKDLSLFYYEYGDKSYFLDRGVTREQIDKWKLGSTHAVLDEMKFKPFVKKLSKKYKKELVENVLDYHQMIFKVNMMKHGNPHYVTIPSFKDGAGRGVCYRSMAFVKKVSFKNLYKFQFSHGPSFCFGEENLDKFDKFFVVEGVFDMLALERIGIENSIALGNNTFSEYQNKKLKDKKLTFIFDNDKGGLFGLHRLGKYIKKKDSNILKITVVPEKGKDIDDMVRENPTKIKSFVKVLEEEV